MAWIALADHAERRFSPRGIGSDKRAQPFLPDDPGYLMPCGTLMFETRLSADGRPQVLFGYNHAHPDQRSLMFQAIPGGGIACVQVQGRDIAHAAIQAASIGRANVLRVTFSWDSIAGRAHLTVERPEDDSITTVAIDNVRPMQLSDLHDLMMGRGDQTLAADVIFTALSDQVEPVGPMPSLARNVPVATPWGYRDAGDLKRGDTVLTHTGAVVPVLQTIARTVPARGSFAPVRLRAPYFGLQRDIITGPEQRLVIDGPEVEYLFSEESVLVPARHLINGFAARAEPTGPTITYCQIILPGHEALLAAGTPIESLYIGRIRRHPDRFAASLLADVDRNGLPEHGRQTFKTLKWYEAIHLARQRAA